jgi:hypothetical protein
MVPVFSLGLLSSVLEFEPTIKSASTNNLGFHLFVPDSPRKNNCFIELKAKRGRWSSGIDLSHTQFAVMPEDREHYRPHVIESEFAKSAFGDGFGSARDSRGIQVRFEQVPRWRCYLQRIQ